MLFLVKHTSSKLLNKLAYAHDVMAAILVFQNNQTAALLVYQTNPVAVQLSSYVNKEGKFIKKLWCCVGGSITRTYVCISWADNVNWPL